MPIVGNQLSSWDYYSIRTLYIQVKKIQKKQYRVQGTESLDLFLSYSSAGHQRNIP